MNNIARVVASIMLSALDAAAKAANGDPESQAFCADIRDQLKPELDWVMRYGKWPVDNLDAASDLEFYGPEREER